MIKTTLLGIGGARGTVVQIDLTSMSELKRFRGEDACDVDSLALLKDGKTLVSTNSSCRFNEHTGRRFGEVTLWDLSTGQVEIIEDKNPWLVCSVCLAPDEKTFATAGDGFGNNLTLWKTDGWKKSKILTGHDRGINSVVFSPDGKNARHWRWR